MEAVSVIVGRAVPLDRRDVDTDQIIPSDWLKRVERTGFGEGLFSEWRESSDFVLNRAEYQGDDVRVLVAGPNFGTGSSREHAPWALEDYGFDAVISPQLRRHLPQQLPEDRARAGGAARKRSSTRIMRAVEDDPSIEIVVDVARPARRRSRDRPRRAVPPRRLPPPPPGQRPRRHRPHPAERRHHHGLRAEAPRLDAGHFVTASDAGDAALPSSDTAGRDARNVASRASERPL